MPANNPLLRDRFAAGLTVGVPEGPDSYRAAGWVLRLMAIAALAVGGFVLIASLFLLPFAVFLGDLAWSAGVSAVGVGFTALLLSGIAIALLFLLVLNHLHIGWSARAGWALWGTRAFTGVMVLSSVWTAVGTAGSGDVVAALSGLGLGTAVLVGLHVLTWMEGTREAFREAEEGSGEDVDAVLETG